MRKAKKRFWTIIVIVLLAAGGIACAPRFLLYSSPYQKTQALILFLGPDFSARQKEAYRIINEGMADYLIIPAYHKMHRITGEGNVKYLSPNLLNKPSARKELITAAPYYYEDTHIEVIEAKKIMDGYGLKSAVFVSSPYHMRRIKLIVERVFAGAAGDFYFVPTSYEKTPENFWRLSANDWKRIGREYMKISWFFLYLLWS